MNKRVDFIYKGYLPTLLDLDKVASGYNINRKSEIHWFINTLYLQRVTNNRYKKKNTYIRLMSKQLEKMMGKDYSKILEYLDYMGVIEVNHSYRVNDHSKSYKLTKKYEDSPTKLIEYSSQKFIEKLKVKDRRRTYDEISVDFNDVDHYVYKNLVNLTFDIKKAYKFIDNMVGKRHPLKKNVKFTEFNQKSYRKAVEAFENQSFYLKRDKNGRMYNNFVNLPKLFKTSEYISYNKEELVEIDLKSAQPFFLYNYLKEKVESIKIELIKNHYVDEQFIEYLYIDLERYKKDYLMYQYGIYIKIGEDFKKRNLTKLNYKKATLKTKFFTYLFSKTSLKPYNLFTNSFKPEFQYIYKFVHILKRNFDVKLSDELQSMEADLILEKLSRELIKKNIYFLPVHDSVTVPVSEKKIVEEILNKLIINRYEFSLNKIENDNILIKYIYTIYNDIFKLIFIVYSFKIKSYLLFICSRIENLLKDYFFISKFAFP